MTSEVPAAGPGAEPTRAAPGPSPGVYRDIPEATYRAWPYVSQSMLHRFLSKSPMHAYYDLTHPQTSAAMSFGSRAHQVLLEPGRLEQECIVAPPGLDRRTKVGKAEWQAILDSGKEPIKTEEYVQLEGLRAAILAHPVASLLVTAPGAQELSLVWDEFSGDRAGLPPLRCKARLDRLTNFEGWATIPDFKTCDDASPKWIGFRIGDYHYHLQDAMYRRGAAAIDRLQGRAAVERRFLFVFVESEPPHGITLHELDEGSRAEADAQLDEVLDGWRRCVQSGVWPGYPGHVQGLSLPEKFWRRE